MLLGAGADVNKAKTDDGATPLLVASENDRTEVVKILLGARADVNKATTENGVTPLFAASQEGHTKVVEMLIGAGADVNKAKTHNGETPLTMSAYSLDDAAALAMVQLIAMAGANLAHVADDGNTAAETAADEDKPLTLPRQPHGRLHEDRRRRASPHDRPCRAPTTPPARPPPAPQARSTAPHSSEAATPPQAALPPAQSPRAGRARGGRFGAAAAAWRPSPSRR